MRERFSFQEIVYEVGEEAGRALVVHFGGTTLAIPAKARPGAVYDEIVAAIGEEGAHKLIHLCARLPLSIPRNAKLEREKRDANMQARFDSLTSTEGLSARKAVRQLAREFGLVERTVWSALKRSTCFPLLRHIRPETGKP